MTDETVVEESAGAVELVVEPSKPDIPDLPENQLGPLSLLASATTDPTPEIEWMMYFGVPTEKARAVEEEKISPATHGRLKVPLCKLLANQNFEKRETDIYMSLVCIEKVDEKSVRASDMLITGSTEVVVEFTDPSPMNGLQIDTLKGACLLVLNPVVTGLRTLTVPCLKNCLRIGRLNQINPCSYPDCEKPVFEPRDGLCCFKHASKQAGLRLSVVGGDHTGASEAKPQEVKKKPRPVMDPAEREALREANRKSELIARKKTAVMLSNRRSEGGTGVNRNPFFSHMRGSDLMELGDADESKGDDREKLERFEILKRKRELIEKRDKQREATVVVPEPAVVAVVPTVSPAQRKSLTHQFDQLIQTERGLN